MINKCYLCRKDGKIMKKKTVKILMGVALISTLLGACSTNRSTQNEQKTLNTEISKIVKNHSESTYEENTKENTEKVVEKIPKTIYILQLIIKLKIIVMDILLYPKWMGDCLV